MLKSKIFWTTIRTVYNSDPVGTGIILINVDDDEIDNGYHWKQYANKRVINNNDDANGNASVNKANHRALFCAISWTIFY